ncbi:PrgI family protein [Bacillus sp. BRMEA1]|uniref:PrgI family protein n=1 Tax=Neobacillus endophyticus TaxID=2738405 RepID=UPI001564D38D|nr:PrgI family protein [Neobacillus endophyticus]NRD81034.1 PrgI family protein [Neobacillus endophyticus]
MSKVTVPIDMASEQKTILGILSKRQLIYLVAGGGLIYWYVPFIFALIPNPVVGVIASVIGAAPVAAVVLILGFLRKEKFHMDYDKYLLTKLQYKTQLGNWRK